jgi:uncharacterized RDD family membrane protein YckC
LSVEHNANPSGTAPLLSERISGEIASGTRRFWTFVIDQITIWIGLLTLQIAYGVAYGIHALEALDGIKWWGISVAFYVIYYVSFEAISGRTLGKVLTGTRVVTTSGLALSMPTALVRTLCRFIPFEPLSFSLSETWWHDSLSRTQVVRSQSAS